DVHAGLGEAPAAQDQYRQALRLETFAATVPDYGPVQRDLSAMYERFGNLLLRLGQAEEACRQFLKALPQRERAAADEPDSIQAQTDLAATWGTRGLVELQRLNFVEAEKWFERGTGLLAKLEARGKFKNLPQFQGWTRTQQHKLAVSRAAPQ